MSFLDMLLVSFSAALNFFEPTMEIGATQKSLQKKKTIIIGAAFGLAQIMVAALGIVMASLIGLLIPYEIQEIVRPYITFAILLLSGLYMIFSAFQNKEVVECRREMMPAKKYIKFAIEHSLRVVAVGAGIFFVYYDWITEILLISTMSVLIAILGLSYGYWRGFKYRKLPYFIGGILLCIIAFKIILIHFN
jgi:putative Mn2+ efflux pump MntP